MKALVLALLAIFSLPLRADLPLQCEQLVVGIAPNANSSHVTLRFYELNRDTWQLTLGPWKGRLGRNGLAWGLGMHPLPAPGSRVKREGDGRAPAGIFALGGAFGYAPAIKKDPQLYYRQITTRDLWVEDPTSPSYNSHLILNREPNSPWEKKQQMRQGDYAHSLKLFIKHNPPPTPRANAGSAIFFHIWRAGGKKPTAGCTTMSEANLRAMIARIVPKKNPHYVLLTEADYQRLRKAWRLP